jgi:hypothetical protein
MRPFTMVLLIIVAGMILFFGYNIYNTRKVAMNTAKTAIKPTAEKLKFKLKVGSNSVYVNDKEVSIDVPVKEIGGRVLVPLSFIGSYLGAQNVNYDPKTEEVTFDLEIPIEKAPKIGSTSSEETQTEDSLLTKENKDKINSTASMSATFFKINKMESDGNTVSIWIDLLMEPKTTEDVRKIADTFANDVSYIFDTKHDIKIISIRTEPGEDNFKKFGTSRFISSSGKIEFTEEK